MFNGIIFPDAERESGENAHFPTFADSEGYIGGWQATSNYAFVQYHLAKDRWKKNRAEFIAKVQAACSHDGIIGHRLNGLSKPHTAYCVRCGANLH